MPSVGDDLLSFLDSIERPGDFCVGELREIVMPAIEIDGIGRIAFPLLPAQIDRLLAIAEAAPYGRGEETVVDRGVRRTWQIAPGRIRIGGRRWPETLADLAAGAARGLGVEAPVAADFYKLLLYDAGSFFVDHRDTEKVSGMFATLSIVLPSDFAGGALSVRHLDREVVLDLHPDEPSQIGLAAFYADCVHEIRPITAGCRVALVYNLRFLGANETASAPDFRTEQQRAAERLKLWADGAEAPDKLVLPLDHAYTPAELSFATLKGRDAGLAGVLVEAAAESGCELRLALVTIEESGSALPTGYYGRRGRWRGGEDDDEEFEVDEVIDSALTLSQWRRPDDTEAGLGEIPFDEDELCPPDGFADLEPDEQYFHEATGNEGASFDRTYRRAGLVLWPRRRRLAVLNHAGLGATLPYLAELAARWEAGGAASPSLRDEADELVGHMLRSWPRHPERAEDDDKPGAMLDLLVRLGNTAGIDEFLAELPAEGHYAGRDNAAILRAAALLQRPRATELVIRIIERNAPSRLDACGDLLRRCAAAPATVDPVEIGAALVPLLPGDPAARIAPDSWHRPAPIKPGFVVDLLAAVSSIDGALAERAVEHVLAWRETYKPDEVLVAAALDFANEPTNAASPAVARLRGAALDHLNRRVALPLAPPADWARTDAIKCTCADCRDLGAFLVDPGRRRWWLKAAERRRGHVEDEVRRARCDLDLSTERRGSPHTLVAVKNEASYERRRKQRQQDLEHVAALGD